jgi:cysteine sulfinate desulfinase/cysteine desulfurase-like protein
MGLDDDLVGNALRVSMGWNTSKTDVAIFRDAYIAMAEKLTQKAA